MRQALILPLIAVTIVTVFSFYTRPNPPQSLAYISAQTPALQSEQAYLLPISEPAYAPIRDTSVAGPRLDANVALVAEVDSGRVLYEKNADARVPIASLTKLLSVQVATELFNPQEIVTVASGSVRVDKLKQTLYEGERIAVHDLISMMLVESSNDAAYALAAYAHQRGINFVEKMNQRAAELGMSQCVFTDPAGLDDSAYCNASNLLKLVRFMFKNTPAVWPVTATPLLTVQSADGKILHELKTTNELLGSLDGIIGGKTGYTDGALGCLILVVKLPGKDDTLVSIVLGSRGRFADTRALVGWVTTAYRW